MAVMTITMGVVAAVMVQTSGGAGGRNILKNKVREC